MTSRPTQGLSPAHSLRTDIGVRLSEVDSGSPVSRAHTLPQVSRQEDRTPGSPSFFLPQNPKPFSPTHHSDLALWHLYSLEPAFLLSIPHPFPATLAAPLTCAEKSLHQPLRNTSVTTSTSFQAM